MSQNPNEELHKLKPWKGIECDRYKRRYPETILNIEAVIHHNADKYECVNRKECKRKRK